MDRLIGNFSQEMSHHPACLESCRGMQAGLLLYYTPFGSKFSSEKFGDIYFGLDIKVHKVAP